MKPDNDESIMYLNPEECCQASTGDSDCPVYDGCYQNPTPDPTLEPLPDDTPNPAPAQETTPDTPEPSPSGTTQPTKCEDRLWYFKSGSCSNGYDDMSNESGDIMYSTLSEAA